MGDKMKKACQYLGLFGIMIFSFYYTNKAAILARDSNPIMKSINEVKNSVEVSSIDAIIEDNYIIPGLNGLTVNITDSFNKMRPYNIFNKYYLVYDQVQPKISLENNKDKIIINGNQSKKEVSLIIIPDKNIINYLDKKELKYDILTNLNNYAKTNERINNEKEGFKELEKKLNNDEINKKICLINSDVDIESCKKKSYYLVKAMELNDNNLIEVKNKIGNGSIILVKDISYEKLDIIINYIKSKGLEFVYLSDLIAETNLN